jgi:hypothetical protein
MIRANFVFYINFLDESNVFLHQPGDMESCMGCFQQFAWFYAISHRMHLGHFTLDGYS